MAIQLKGTACMAVNQDSMYIVIEGSQSLGGDDGLLTLIKADHPTMDAGNITWTVVSTMPAKSIWSEYDVFGEISSATCSVDKNGVFTLRLKDGSGLRYDPMATKTPQYQTCSSDSNGLGEWRRAFLVTTLEGSYIEQVIRPEIVGSDSGNSSLFNYGDELVISRSFSGTEGPPTLRFARIDKEALLANLTSNDFSPPIMLSQKNETIKLLEYGDSQIFSVLAFEPKIPVSGTDQTTYNRTLTYFPFEAPFHLTSPPTGAVSVPWNVDCGKVDVAVAAKAKFYYICSDLDPSTNLRTYRLYIFDSKTKQTLGPFTSQDNNVPLMYSYPRLLPVYSTTHQDEPQFLVANWLAQYNTSADPRKLYEPTSIDLHVPNNSSQAWPKFIVAESIPVGEGLDPSCRTRRSSQKLLISAIVSSLFGVAVAVILVFMWKRKQMSKTTAADNDSLDGQNASGDKFERKKPLETDP